MKFPHEGAAFLVAHSLFQLFSHVAGDEFKELRPRAAMWQEYVLTVESDNVLCGCSQLNPTKDRPLCPLRAKRGSLVAAEPESLIVWHFP